MRKIFFTFLILATTASVTAQRTKRSKRNQEEKETTEESAETKQQSGFAKIFVDGSKDLGIKSSKGESYLPEAGNWGISFDAAPFLGFLGNAFNNSTANNSPFANYSNGFQGKFVGRYFITDKRAFRVIFNLGFVSQTDKFNDGSVIPATFPNLGNGFPAPGTPVVNDYKISQSGFDLTVGLGKEWRRGNTRLQGFYGADAFLSIGTRSSKIAITDKIETSVTNSNGTVVPPDPNDGRTLVTLDAKNGTNFGIGINGFLGAEYFIMPKFSIGAQYTYGFGLDFKGTGELVQENYTYLPASPQNPTNVLSVSREIGSSSKFNFGGVGLVSLNLSLYF